jgi:two-component system sensor histidine kinase HydH
MNEPGETGQMQAGPGFENALRTCLLSGIVLLPGDNKAATVSPEVRQILGFPPNQGSEVPIEMLPAGLLSVAKEALASGKPSSARQVDVPSKGITKSVQVSAVPLGSISSNSAVVLTIHALNTTSQFQQQIRQLDRLANAGTLAAGMAHEIKNALVAGRTFLDLLLEKNTDADLVQIVRRETGRIDAIVSRMLRFASTTTTMLSAVHVHEVLEIALRLIQPQLSSKSISLERLFQANLDLAKGDEYELEQAFVNLLLNAVEAMTEKGKLVVGTETLSAGIDGLPRIRVMIKDTGAGVLPEHMSHLFEPFFTTKASGTGLGLAITRRILQEHGGSISVESRTGQGTTFSIILPLLIDNSGS